ncbi:hypothetical protein [Paenibacillus validus]|uniref:hypothetical protein n=1 Tax=Paenibacillus validus TaxID=44253 RepID=UPI003D2E00D6
MDSKQIHLTTDGMEISINGESGMFNGIDLQIGAIRALVEMIDYKFAEEIDPEVRQKATLRILDAVGAAIKVDMRMFGHDAEMKNIEAVQEFLSWITTERIHEQPTYAYFLDNATEDEETEN